MAAPGAYNTVNVWQFYHTLTKHVPGTCFVKMSTPIIWSWDQQGLLFASQSVQSMHCFSWPFVLQDIFWLERLMQESFPIQPPPPPPPALKSQMSGPDCFFFVIVHISRWDLCLNFRSKTNTCNNSFGHTCVSKRIISGSILFVE